VRQPGREHGDRLRWRFKVRKRIALCLAYVFCISAGAAFGQTAAQIKERYGQPTESYSVSDSIWMTPEFTDDGQVCRMKLYPKRVSATTNYLYDSLDRWELAKVLDQLAPPETRGKKTEYFGFTVLLGQSASTLYAYENVSISFLSSLRNMKLLERPDELIFKEAEPADTKKPDTRKSNEETMVPRGEIAIITWTGRTCAKQ
jgi:hypothetical protein